VSRRHPDPLHDARPARSEGPSRDVASARAPGAALPSAGSAAGGGRAVVVGPEPLALADVVALARGEARPVLSDDAGWRARLEASRAHLARAVAAGPVYGVTTGVGSSVANAVPEAHRAELALSLQRLHGCGTGRILEPEEAAAVLAARIATLARGCSGIRWELLERLCLLLDARALPRIPAEGSIGASGDLTPLSYLAAVVAGERSVSWRGEVVPAADALAALGVAPLALEPRETLALMNGTSMMTGLACLAHARTDALARLACALAAMVSEAIHGNPDHFAAPLFALRPHPGSVQAAAWIRAHRETAPRARPVARLQDRYSVRCAPQVIGVLLDALAWAGPMLETELGGVDDNPVVDPESGRVLHGGNFYGGHVGFAMDALKTAVASLADLLDRQLVLLCMPETSDGLPENLVAVAGERRFSHHGFKAMQIGASALAAEAQKLTVPASAFSRSSESHNQDKVSMGTIAARDALRVVELSEGVAGIVLLAAVQAAELRGHAEEGSASGRICAAVRAVVPPLVEDRPQDDDLARVLRLHRAGGLPLPAGAGAGAGAAGEDACRAGGREDAWHAGGH